MGKKLKSLRVSITFLSLFSTKLSEVFAKDFEIFFFFSLLVGFCCLHFIVLNSFEIEIVGLHNFGNPILLNMRRNKIVLIFFSVLFFSQISLLLTYSLSQAALLRRLICCLLFVQCFESYFRTAPTMAFKRSGH